MPAHAPADVPSVSVAAGAGVNTFSTDTFGANFRAYIAAAITAALEKHGIHALADLAADDRLKVVASYSYDYLPSSIRLIVGATVGRAVFERYLFDFLIHLRTRIPSDRRNVELRPFVIELARGAWLSDNLAAIYERSRSGLSSLATYVPTGGLQQARAWKDRLIGGRAPLPEPVALAPPVAGLQGDQISALAAALQPAP